MLTYEETAATLKSRILALIPDHPEILEIESAWRLFDVPGFSCNDLGPSLYQAQWALAAAIQEWKSRAEPRP